MKNAALVLAAVILLAVPLQAREPERSTLLTADGTLYVIDAVPVLATDGANTGSEHLVLTTRRGREIAKEIVPASWINGVHRDAAMIYDNQSGTLFVFWVRQASLMHSELLFAFRNADGIWSDPATFGSPFDYRENLRIAITNQVSNPDDDSLEAGTCIHLVWWEFDTHTGTESAQYAMLPIENGMVGEISFIELRQFADGEPVVPGEEIDPTVLKQPMLFLSGRDDSVEVVFGDLETKGFHEVHIRPVFKISENGRLRVPIGRSQGGFSAPRFTAASNSQMNAVYRDSDNLAFYTQEGDRLHFVLREHGTWLDAQSTMLDDQVTAADAISAIRRLLNLN